MELLVGDVKGKVSPSKARPTRRAELPLIAESYSDFDLTGRHPDRRSDRHRANNWHGCSSPPGEGCERSLGHRLSRSVLFSPLLLPSSFSFTTKLSKLNRSFCLLSPSISLLYQSLSTNRSPVLSLLFRNKLLPPETPSRHKHPPSNSTFRRLHLLLRLLPDLPDRRQR